MLTAKQSEKYLNNGKINTKKHKLKSFFCKDFYLSGELEIIFVM